MALFGAPYCLRIREYNLRIGESFEPQASSGEGLALA